MEGERAAPGTVGLRPLQLWMQAVITHPDGPEVGAASTQAMEQIPLSGSFDQLVESRSRLSAEQRLALYSRGYHLRLLECLRSMHPGLQHALGPELFDQFALDYLADYPSRSCTLHELNGGFASYLEASRPELQEGEEPWPEFLIDLARLERIFMEVFDGPGSEDLPLADVKLMAPPDRQFEELTFVSNPSLRLHRSRYPVGTYLRSVRHGLNPRLPPALQTYLALYRRSFRVLEVPLTQAEFQVLTLLDAGRTVAETSAEVGEKAQTVWQWGTVWWAREMFVDLRGDLSPLEVRGNLRV
jgi:hypothetical protein